MTHQDADRFAHALGVVRIAYPNAAGISQEMARVYFMACEDLPIEEVEAGAVACVRRPSAYFPSAGEFRAACLGPTKDNAQIAWMDMRKEIARAGYTGTPKLDAATMETIEGLWGSWPHLCRTLPGEGPELLGWAKRFESSYNALAERRTRAAYIGRGEAKTVLGGLMKQIAAHRDRGQLPPREAGR
jgi:hypothetical protein